MIISREYTVSPKTSVLNKIEDEIKTAKGTVTKVSVQSAPGVNGEIFFRLLHLESSIVPDETEQWIPLTGTRQEYQLEFSDWHNVYKLMIEICSPDARFSHKINVEIEMAEQMTLTQLFTTFVLGGFKWPTQ